ncbi:MAG: hypothetical protein KVP17_000286 [Porospora cf. gigantea B]|uniref:uncharacterized protein n=1 Tax=Porospora cf. gigantea B TaxID=2853592 RepID=UPI003571C4FB|nr:MAG: hypothetical protein KVP17_000286 [Porospora cf. gigantea B]
MWRLTVTPNKRNTNNPVFNHDCSTIIDFEVPDVPGVLEEATWRGVGQGRRVEQLDPNAVDLPGGPTIILGVWDRHYRRSAKGSRPLGYVRLSIKDILGASFKSDVVRRQVTHHVSCEGS